MCLKEKSFVEIVALPWGVVSANITLRVTTAQITGRMVQWDVKKAYQCRKIRKGGSRGSSDISKNVLREQRYNQVKKRKY